MPERTILYIEDDESTAEVVTEILELEHYRVIVDNGHHMHRIIRGQHIGLILMDENLNWCWGSSLCNEVKEDPVSGTIPVILVTSAKDIDKIARNCGADDYLAKPFNIYDIIQKVNKWFLANAGHAGTLNREANNLISKKQEWSDNPEGML